ncbi:MAG: hypothetical protein ACOCWG_05355, partial [bacterium]
LKETLDQIQQDDKYSQYFNNKKNIQIPLFKYIRNDSYEIFLGIPFNTTLEEIKKLELKSINDSVSHAEDDVPFFKSYQKDYFYLTEYITKHDEQLVYIFTLSNSPNHSDSLFNKLNIVKRIFHNE